MTALETLQAAQSKAEQAAHQVKAVALAEAARIRQAAEQAHDIALANALAAFEAAQVAAGERIAATHKPRILEALRTHWQEPARASARKLAGLWRDLSVDSHEHLGADPAPQVLVHAAMTVLGLHSGNGRVGGDQALNAAGRFANAATSDNIAECETTLADFEKVILQHQPGDPETLRRIEACAPCVSHRQFALVDEALQRTIAAEKQSHFAATYRPPVPAPATDYWGRPILDSAPTSPIGGALPFGGRVLNGIASMLR